MPNYKEMYYVLFNKITDIIGDLQEIQQQAEEIYLDSPHTEIIVFDNHIENEK